MAAASGGEYLQATALRVRVALRAGLVEGYIRPRPPTIDGAYQVGLCIAERMSVAQRMNVSPERPAACRTLGAAHAAGRAEGERV